LRGSIPTFIHITHGKWHDSNILDLMNITTSAIYVMDKAYVDFKALYNINEHDAYWITRAKDNMRYEIVETNYNIDESTGLLAISVKPCHPFRSNGATLKDATIIPNFFTHSLKYLF